MDDNLEEKIESVISQWKKVFFDGQEDTIEELLREGKLTFIQVDEAIEAAEYTECDTIEVDIDEHHGKITLNCNQTLMF